MAQEIRLLNLKPSQMRNEIRILTLLSALLLPVCLFAQTVVNGRVSESGTNLPLQGATVTVKGTTTVTQTDADGKFSINVKSPSAKLVISFVGYLPQTVDATNN